MNRRLRWLAVPVVVLVATGTYLQASGSAQTRAGAKPVDRQAAARRLLESPNGRYLSGAARSALQQLAGGRAPASDVGEAPRAASTSGTPSPAAAVAPPTNVRVNNPVGDHREDQTTQSETSVAVSGTHVAVGYNDSQHTLLAFTAGTDLDGYGYSSDGGKTFTDGGVIPNAPGAINLGDPWLGSDRSGAMYYASLVGDDIGNVEIGVARSADGGQSWRAPVLLGRHPADFYFADKEALTAGRDPAHADRDIAYAAWDDFDVNETSASTGLPVAHSSDGGNTWKTVYADQITLEAAGCSFAQYIGAQPLVNPADGTLYVAAEKIEAVDPDCVGAPITFSQVIFTSSDGGDTFAPGRKISSVSPAGGEAGALVVGPGQVIRTIEFPTLAIVGKTLYAAWNDGGSGHSHIVLAQSSDKGSTWKKSTVTSGGGDDLQPALSADKSGLHLLFYRVGAGGRVATDLASATPGSADALTWTVRRISSASFPVPSTSPNFDPIISQGYMGDYIANVSDGTHVYLSWGDNRDVVKGNLYPAGRADPDVFFARQ